MTPAFSIFLCIAALVVMAIIIEATKHEPRPIPNPRCPPRKWELQRDARVRADARAAQLANPGHTVTITESPEGLAIAWSMGVKV
jgi:hypothetical protein